MTAIRPWMLIAAYLLGAMTFGPEPTLPPLPGIGWLWPIGGAAPFKVPDGTPVAVIVVYDDKPEAIQKLTSEQAIVTTDTGDGSARKAIEAAGGKFRLLTPSPPPGEYEEQWVRDAFAKKGGSLPWIVAAGTRGGFSQEVPGTVRGADVVSKLKSISGK